MMSLEFFKLVLILVSIGLVIGWFSEMRRRREWEDFQQREREAKRIWQEEE